MLKSLQLLGLILGLSLTATSFSLTLNGIASYEVLRKEVYIASLYLTEPSNNPQAILSTHQNKRMALKVISKRWSPRRWSRMWQNDIAINNPFVSDDKLTHQLMTFSGLLGAPLVQGDKISIDYISNVGTRISINNVQIISTTSDRLFNLLVNAWIGKLPPSGEFKRRILNGSDDEIGQTLKSRFNSVNYTHERSQVIASWITKRSNAQMAKLKAKAAALAKKKSALLNQAKREKAQTDKNRNAKTLKTNKLIGVAKPKPTKTYVVPKKIAEKKKLSKPKKIASIQATRKAVSKQELAAQNSYYLALYLWELKREIRSSINYPPWALKFGQKGTVKTHFSVDRSGVVSKFVDLDEKVSELLLAEVQNAIKNVAPFILPPDALVGSEWPVSFSYKFDPKNNRQAYLKKPVMPASLSSSNKLSRAQYNKILSRYNDEIKTIISSNIEYPIWSKKLNHRGTVEIEIKVNREGLVESAKDINLTRHETLNRQVRDAIEKSQPLPSIPEALRLNATKMKVTYKFK